MGVFFSIRTRKSRGLAALQVRVQMTSPKVNIIQTTPIRVDIETYQLDRNSLKWGRYIKSPEGKDLLQKEHAIENGINYVLQKGGGISPEQVRKVVEDVCFAELRRKENEAQARMHAAKEKEQRVSFLKYRHMSDSEWRACHLYGKEFCAVNGGLGRHGIQPPGRIRETPA
ncbi:MAG: hypothetical protein K6F98_04590 [Bacteroidales bacterium]|nr:hypothetical protein [Bacteroidales bacterium]